MTTLSSTANATVPRGRRPRLASSPRAPPSRRARFTQLRRTDNGGVAHRPPPRAFTDVVGESFSVDALRTRGRDDASDAAMRLLALTQRAFC
jgi:hypothetical protein